MKMLKLVRDRIPELIKSGRWFYESVHHRPLNPEKWLRHKLMEEVSEYLEDRTAEELADIIEVCFAIGVHIHGITPSELLQVAQIKRDERGGYKNLTAIWLLEGND